MSHEFRVGEENLADHVVKIDPWQPVRDMFASISAPFVLDGALSGLRTVYEEVEGERNRYAHENRRLRDAHDAALRVVERERAQSGQVIDKLRAELAEARAQRDVWRRQVVELVAECDGLRDELAVTHGQHPRAELREWVCVAEHHHPGPHPRNEGCRVAPIPEGVATSRGYGDK